MHVVSWIGYGIVLPDILTQDPNYIMRLIKMLPENEQYNELWKWGLDENALNDPDSPGTPDYTEFDEITDNESIWELIIKVFHRQGISCAVSGYQSMGDKCLWSEASEISFRGADIVPIELTINEDEKRKFDTIMDEFFPNTKPGWIALSSFG